MISELRSVWMPLPSFQRLTIQLISNILPVVKSRVPASFETKSQLSPNPHVSVFLFPKQLEQLWNKCVGVTV